MRLYYDFKKKILNEQKLFLLIKINETFLEQQLNLQKAQHEFVSKLARLKYVEHLESKSDPGTCPICQSDEHKQVHYIIC